MIRASGKRRSTCPFMTPTNGSLRPKSVVSVMTPLARKLPECMTGPALNFAHHALFVPRPPRTARLHGQLRLDHAPRFPAVGLAGRALRGARPALRTHRLGDAGAAGRDLRCDPQSPRGRAGASPRRPLQRIRPCEPAVVLRARGPAAPARGRRSTRLLLGDPRRTVCLGEARRALVGRRNLGRLRRPDRRTRSRTCAKDSGATTRCWS